MTTNDVVPHSGPNCLRWPGRILALTVAVFWLWWGVGSSLYQGLSWVSLLAGVAILVTAFLLWALVFHGGFRQMAAIVWSTIGLPPLLAGVLFLASWRQQLRGEHACPPNIDTPFLAW